MVAVVRTNAKQSLHTEILLCELGQAKTTHKRAFWHTSLVCFLPFFTQSLHLSLLVKVLGFGELYSPQTSPHWPYGP